jgi:hypothetical protein
MAIATCSGSGFHAQSGLNTRTGAIAYFWTAVSSGLVGIWSRASPAARTKSSVGHDVATRLAKTGTRLLVVFTITVEVEVTVDVVDADAERVRDADGEHERV